MTFFVHREDAWGKSEQFLVPGSIESTAVNEFLNKNRFRMSVEFGALHFDAGNLLNHPESNRYLHSPSKGKKRGRSAVLLLPRNEFVVANSHPMISCKCAAYEGHPGFEAAVKKSLSGAG